MVSFYDLESIFRADRLAPPRSALDAIGATKNAKVILGEQLDTHIYNDRAPVQFRETAHVPIERETISYKKCTIEQDPG